MFLMHYSSCSHGYYNISVFLLVLLLWTTLTILDWKLWILLLMLYIPTLQIVTGNIHVFPLLKIARKLSCWINFNTEEINKYK